MIVTTLPMLARDLERAAAEMPVKAAALVTRTALLVTAEARRNATQSSGQHAKHYPQTITYESSAGGLAAEVGPERKGQGMLGHLLEAGSRHSPPHRDLGRAVDTEEPLFLAEAVKLANPWL